MLKRTLTGLAVSTALATAALAQSTWPEDGWWWDPEAPGRGYLIERQGDTMFIASFHYGDSGAAEWLTASGDYAPTGGMDPIGSFEGDVFENRDGQCLGCSWQAAVQDLSAQGPLRITFTDHRNGTLAWSGETIAIQRTAWGWNDVAGQLSGDWLLTLIENGSQASQLVRIADQGNGVATVENRATGMAVGTVEVIGGEAVLTLVDASEPVLPLALPESQRFYAGYSDDNALQAVGLRLDDLPMAITLDEAEAVASAIEQFRDGVSITDDGNTLVLVSDGLPDHPSPYWGEGHANYEVPHAGMAVNPNRIAEQDLVFRLPANPQVANAPSDTSLGAIGVAINGVPFYNQYAGIDRATGEFLPLDREIESFDAYNGHPQQSGQYHYHFEPLHLTVDSPAAFLGFALDGFPIYGPMNPDGSALALDECNGETHATPEHPDGIYHYHITQVAPYVLGCFRGTPGTVSQ